MKFSSANDQLAAWPHLLVTLLGTVSKIPGRDDLKADMFSSDSWVRIWRRRCGKVILVARPRDRGGSHRLAQPGIREQDHSWLWAYLQRCAVRGLDLPTGSHVSKGPPTPLQYH